ncbi:hypothetical protein niasHT_035402 [Heterodera trifolii]|uniref:Uncharacterized protein n=1 Tax=Heterodera trifolii TaxID=157864 RepID=A0ABD2I1Z2_9BILA
MCQCQWSRQLTEMANSPLLLLPILPLSIFCAFLSEIAIGMPSLLKTPEALDKMDGISAVSSSTWTSPTISGCSTPEMGAGTANLRRCASIATDRMPTTYHGAGRGRSPPTLSQQIRMPLSSPPRRTSNYNRSLINSPRKVPLADYQPVTSLCLPRRMDRLFRSRSSTDERRRNSSKKYGTNPPNFFSPSGFGTTSREPNAQLSRESSGSKKKQQQNVEEEKDKEKEKEKERDGTPNILKNLMPKSKSHKKREEKEEEKGQEKPKKEQTQPKGGKNLMRLWKLALNKTLGEKKQQKNGSSEDISLRQGRNESSEDISLRQGPSSPALSDTSTFQGFPSPDLKFQFHDSPNWPGFTKSGENSNSAKAKSKESAENSSAGGEEKKEEKAQKQKQMIEN